MKLLKIKSVVIIIAVCFAKIALAGVWASNNFVYKPNYGESGITSYNNFSSGLTRIDTRLGYEIWVGDPKYGTTLQDAVTTIGTMQVTLHLTRGTYSITSNLTIPTNINLHPEQGAIFQIATGITLTVNGDLQAGLYQVFSCSGTGKVVFGSGAVKEVHPEWWGADAGGVADSTAALQAAVQAQKKVVLAGRYKASALSFTTGRQVWMEGSGWDQSAITFTNTSSPGLLVNLPETGNPYFTLKKVNLIGPGGSDAGNYGIMILTSTPGGQGLSRVNIADVRVSDWGSDALYLKANTGPVSIDNLQITNCGGFGQKIITASGFNSQDVTIRGGSIHGNCAGGISIDAAEGSSNSTINVSNVDIELDAATQPLLYLNNVFGGVFSKLTLSSAATGNSSNSLVYAAGASQGNVFVGLSTYATGGLDNFYFDGPGNGRNMIIGGFHVNSASPSDGFGYFAKVGNTAGSFYNSFINPNLGIFAARHRVVYELNSLGNHSYCLGVAKLHGTDILLAPVPVFTKYFTWNPGTVAAGTSVTQDFTLAGARDTLHYSQVMANRGGQLPGCILGAAITNTDTITVTLFNGSGNDKTFTADIDLIITLYINTAP
jgi:hypothetical protein